MKNRFLASVIDAGVYLLPCSPPLIVGLSLNQAQSEIYLQEVLFISGVLMWVLFYLIGSTVFVFLERDSYGRTKMGLTLKGSKKRQLFRALMLFGFVILVAFFKLPFLLLLIPGLALLGKSPFEAISPTTESSCLEKDSVKIQANC